MNFKIEFCIFDFKLTKNVHFCLFTCFFLSLLEWLCACKQHGVAHLLAATSWGFVLQVCIAQILSVFVLCFLAFHLCFFVSRQNTHIYIYTYIYSLSLSVFPFSIYFTKSLLFFLLFISNSGGASTCCAHQNWASTSTNRIYLHSAVVAI